jgi:hypothetical protein
MHMKCNIGNDIAFTLSSMMRVINMVLPSVNSEPNIVDGVCRQFTATNLQGHIPTSDAAILLLGHNIPEICISMGARFGLNKTATHS